MSHGLNTSSSSSSSSSPSSSPSSSTSPFYSFSYSSCSPIASITVVRQSYDSDKDGVLSFAEFSAALKTLGYEDAQIQKVFKRADMDGSGSIDR